MRTFLVMIFAALLGGSAHANSIDPNTTQLPWVNGPAADSVYRVVDSFNKVHVWEAFTISCPYCHRNAQGVKDLARYFEELGIEDENYERVQFLDLCLNSNVRDCQNWVNQHRPDYPVVQDQSRYVWSNLAQANSIPQTFVTNCAGELIAHTIGQWNAAAVRLIKSAVDEALATECADPSIED